MGETETDFSPHAARVKALAAEGRDLKDGIWSVGCQLSDAFSTYCPEFRRTDINWMETAMFRLKSYINSVFRQWIKFFCTAKEKNNDIVELYSEELKASIIWPFFPAEKKTYDALCASTEHLLLRKMLIADGKDLDDGCARLGERLRNALSLYNTAIWHVAVENREDEMIRLEHTIKFLFVRWINFFTLGGGEQWTDGYDDNEIAQEIWPFFPEEKKQLDDVYADIRAFNTRLYEQHLARVEELVADGRNIREGRLSVRKELEDAFSKYYDVERHTNNSSKQKCTMDALDHDIQCILELEYAITKIIDKWIGFFTPDAKQDLNEQCSIKELAMVFWIFFPDEKARIVRLSGIKRMLEHKRHLHHSIEGTELVGSELLQAFKAFHEANNRRKVSEYIGHHDETLSSAKDMLGRRVSEIISRWAPFFQEHGEWRYLDEREVRQMTWEYFPDEEEKYKKLIQHNNIALRGKVRNDMIKMLEEYDTALLALSPHDPDTQHEVEIQDATMRFYCSRYNMIIEWGRIAYGDVGGDGWIAINERFIMNSFWDEFREEKEHMAKHLEDLCAEFGGRVRVVLGEECVEWDPSHALPDDHNNVDEDGGTEAALAQLSIAE